MAKTTISLDIPKSAAERAARSVLFDILGQYRVGDINHEQAAEAIEHWRTSVNASLQSEDAVERVARIMVRTDPNYCIYHMPGDTPRDWKATSGYRGKTSELSESAAESVRVRARAILATGLVPDEAAIRKGSDQ
ncbi:MAG: hypothetical protein J0I08_16845 [Rhizobiales bacterium]|nr:hypothetical protein [Hyphomicrobiales bacterium]